MNWPRRIGRRIDALVKSDEIDHDLDEEMELHVSLEAEEIARREGVPPDEARRRALVAFGGLTKFREEHRSVRGLQWLERSMRELRHASRGLVRTPGFTLAAVGVLALGIGSTTAVFTAVNAVLRNPAHDDLAIVFYRGFPSLSTVDFRAIENEQRSFTAVGAMRRDEVAFRAGGDAERVDVGRVTSGFFRVLGVTPAAGRLIEPRDEPVGTERIAVVSHALATRALGGAQEAVGQRVTLDGFAHTVIGVLPPTTEPLLARADVYPALQLATPERRGPFGMLVIARLRPGTTFESATRDVTTISERVFLQWSRGVGDRNARYEATPFRTAALASSSRMLRIFGAAVALVLLIGVANVASLMLVRAIGRSREVSLRAVLGASSVELTRMFVMESALLCAAGAALGIALGSLGLRALIAYGPQMPGLSGSSLDTRAVLFAVALAILAALVVATYPAIMLLRKRHVGLTIGTRAIGGRGTSLLRSGFVVAQFALALPLLAISGLLLLSFMRMQQVDPGFDPANMLTVRVSLPTGQYPDSAAIGAYWARALPRIRALGGVENLGVGTSMPPDDFGSSNDNFNLIDRPAPPAMAEPNAPWPMADAGYFATLGVRLLEGRPFLPTDGAEAPAVLVSRSWAQKFYPRESPIGKKMVRGGCTECPPSTVVGVVDDVRYSGLAGPLDAMYSPVTEDWPRTVYLYVRTAMSPDELIVPVRDALRSVDPSVPLDDVASMEERLYTAVAQPRQWATLLGGFAAAALGLAAVGVFGMLSYSVSTRRREIGVRMAIGAQPRRIIRMIVGSGITHAIIGSVIGLAAALIGTRALTSVLFDVRPGDPVMLGLATAALLLVALFACWLPARRAAAIDPLEAIRAE